MEDFQTDAVTTIHPDFLQYTGSILPRYVIDNKKFNSDILRTNPAREIKINLSASIQVLAEILMLFL